MEQNGKTSKRTLSTYVEDEIAQAVEAEARKLRVSTSAVVRWALMERYGVGQSEASGTEEA